MNAKSSDRRDRLIGRITEYLAGGGLFNPELANHDAVRELLIETRDYFLSQTYWPQGGPGTQEGIHRPQQIKMPDWKRRLR
jgi:hypothetical protein